MIYELEKIELWGNSSLNYYTLGLMITKYLLAAALITFLLSLFASSSTDSKENQDTNDIWVADDIWVDTFAFCLSTAIISGILTFIMSMGIGEYTSHKVPLSTIGDKITIQGEKVVIDKFDEPYGYESFSEDKGESTPKRNAEQIFKFEYNELYESGKLITEKGSYYELSKEDAKFLKERGVS